MYMWQSQVENKHYSVFTSINSPKGILLLLRPKVGILLANRYESLSIKFELSGRYTD